MDKQFTSEMWDKAWDKGFKITENIKYNEACLKSYPDIKKTVWNNPATIVILKTGEKGVAKVQPGDIWNAELGFWVAYAKALQTKRCFPAYLKELAYNPCNVYQWETSLVRSTVDIKATVPYCLAKKWGLVP